MKRFFCILVCVAVVISLCACNSQTNTSDESNKIKVVCTIFPQYDFVRQIAGDLVDIKLLIAPDAEVHGYEPSLSDLKSVHECDLFIYCSGESESWSKDLLDSAGGTTLDICEGIELGLFKYVAHPDYFMINQNTYSNRKKAAVLKIAKCAKAHDVVIEINLKGCKYGKRTYDFGESYMYPNDETYRIIGEVGTKVCFGYDAHNPLDLMERRDREYEMKERFKAYHLNFIDDLDL